MFKSIGIDSDLYLTIGAIAAEMYIPRTRFIMRLAFMLKGQQ